MPTLLVAGWYDLYTDTMTRVYGRLRAPKRILVGPWLHVSPELAQRERIEWLEDVIAWSDGALRDHGRRVRDSAGERAVVCFVDGAGCRGFDDWAPPGTEGVARCLASGAGSRRTRPLTPVRSSTSPTPPSG